jgi:hypothetical protein
MRKMNAQAQITDKLTILFKQIYKISKVELFMLGDHIMPMAKVWLCQFSTKEHLIFKVLFLPNNNLFIMGWGHEC